MFSRYTLIPFLLALFSTNTTEAASLKLKRGNHVVWIGNTFAERMQYFGEIESRLHARYPKHNLVIRNLAWSADTITLRPRPKDFGDIHHYLFEAKADVILACYGFNETWDYEGNQGITRFESNLTSFLKELQSKNYNSSSSPKIVLYSPLACEGITVPNTNTRNHLLSLYTNTMERVATSLGIPFVNLYLSLIHI